MRMIRLAKFAVILGILFGLEAAVALGQTLQISPRLVVVDADGKTVGTVLDAGDFATGGAAMVADVAFMVGDVPFVLEVYQDGFATGAQVSPPIAWESSDCSGTAFLGLFTSGGPGVKSSGGSMPYAEVGVPGNTVYVQDGATETVTIGSYSTFTVAVLANDYSQPVSKCLNTGFPVGTQAVLFPAKALINMNDEFRVPFVVRSE